MSTHADAVREAERAVVEAAVAWRSAYDKAATVALYDAIDALFALRAATCPTCGGHGRVGVEDSIGTDCGYIPCPAGCDHGRRRDG